MQVRLDGRDELQLLVHVFIIILRYESHIDRQGETKLFVAKPFIGPDFALVKVLIQIAELDTVMLKDKSRLAFA